MRDFQAAINRGVAHEVRIVRPFAGLGKREVMRFGVGLPLELTFSCISPQGNLHCGQCNKCAERQAAFQAAEMPDKTSYAQPMPPASRAPLC
jgi:7-cyano-7-deazaguanine synthase